MTESESRWRAAIITYFPMLIAVLSLVTSIYNGYLNNKFVVISQGNLSRGEYLRTCKEIIDGYFQVKLKVGVINANSGRQGDPARSDSSTPQGEAANAVSHFAALGTYLANLRDETARTHYTQLSDELEKIAKQAARLSPGELKT